MVELQVDEVLGGRYRLQEHIRTGSVTELWYARDMVLRRNVGLRIVQVKMLDDPQYLVRFTQESQILARLEHPHITPIYDYGVHEERPFQVQRFIGVDNLYEWYRKQPKPIPALSLTKIAQQLASSLDFIHEHGIVHRALRASTVIINENAQAFLINFTLAKDLRNRNPLLDDNNSYVVLSPDERQGAEIDISTDIYAYGLLVYSLFTGEREPQFRYNQVISRVRDKRPDLPIGVDIVVSRLLHPEKSHRYQSAGQAAEDLIAAFYSGQTSIDGRIFISYARKDRDYVYRLAAELRHIGLDIWIDQDIEAGSNWDDSIESALKETDIMLLILSEASAISDYVTHEWSFFMGSGKPVYPFVLQSSPPEKIHPRLNRVQHIMGTDDLFMDVSRIVDVLAGGNPSKIAEA